MPSATGAVLIALALSSPAAGQELRRPQPEPANPALPTVFLIGDSTVRNGQGDGSNGQWGWGEPIATFFDPAKVNVVNLSLIHI